MFSLISGISVAFLRSICFKSLEQPSSCETFSFNLGNKFSIMI